ncbi:MAG TPA: tetratricopeptide repeat protein [Candidatus Coatesbacteria bacterium]|nr:tetratricopeptide repeat protein [Candidatus Coatesbacteria bacterium]
MRRLTAAILFLLLVSPAPAQERAVDEALAPAISAYHEGRFEEAQLMLVSYLTGAPEGEKPPSAAEAYFYLALIDEERGDLAEAERFYTAALEAWPDYARALAALGTLLSMRGAYEQAQTKLERAVALDRDSALAQANLGYVYLAQDLLSKAESRFTQAVELKTDYVFARVNLGYIYMVTARYEEAADQFRYALALEPDNLEANANLADLLVVWAKSYGDAYEHYHRVMQLLPDDFIAHQRVGYIYTVIGDWGSAQDYLERALDVKPGDADTQSLLDYVRRKVAEGPPPGPVISQVLLDGNANDEREGILAAFGLKPGQPYSEESVKDGLERIRDYFRGRPIGGVSLEARTEEQFEGKAVSLELEVVTGEAAVLGAIELRGLVNTPMDVVEPILAAHRLFVGAPYDSREVFAAVRELYETGLFASVSRNLRAGLTPDEIDLILLFEEKRGE